MSLQGVSEDGRDAPSPPLQPTTAAGAIRPNPWRTEKRRRWLRQEVISRQKITDMHIGFGLEAKNVDLVIRDESQTRAGYKKEN